MSSEAPPSPPRPAAHRARREVIAIAGAAAVVIVTLAVILLFGLVPLPSFPNLQDQPDLSIPGTVALVRSERERQCLATVPAGGGAVTDLRCTDAWFATGGVAWTEQGDLTTVLYGPGQPEVVLIDGESGEELDRAPATDPDPDPAIAWQRERQERADGSRLLLSGGAGGQAAVRVRDPDGRSRDLLAVEGPEDYRFTSAQWSPDGDWVLVADSRGRLLVIADDGDPGARILATADGDIGMAFAWYIPGEPTFTVSEPS